MPEVKIILTAEQKQAVAAFQQLRRESAATLQSLNAGTKTATAGLQAFNSVAIHAGGFVAPQLTSGFLSATAAINSLREASAAASIPLTRMVGLVAALGGIIAIGKFAKDMGDAQLTEANSNAGLIESNEALAKSIMKVVQARLANQEITAEEFAAIQSRVFDAKNSNNPLDVQEGLRTISSGLVSGRMSRTEFMELRKADELAAATRRLEAAERDLNKTEGARLLNRREAIRFELAELELRKKFTDLGERERVITAVEADKLRTDDLRDRVQLLKELRDVEMGITNSDPSLTSAQKFAENKRLGIEQEGYDPNSMPEQLLAGWMALKESIGTVQQQIAQSWVDVMGAAVNSTTDSIMGLVDGTMTWNDALRNVGRTILTEIIRSIAQMVSQYIVGQVAIRSALAFTSLFHAKVEAANTAATVAGAATRTSASLGEAGAEAVNTGAKAASSVASIPYVGWALAIAAFAGVVAMIANAASNARAMGGPVTAGQPHLVGELGPEIFVPNYNGFVMSNEDSMRALKPISVGAGSSSSGKSSTVNQSIHMHWEKAEMVRALREDISAIAIDAFRNNKVELGFTT